MSPKHTFRDDDGALWLKETLSEGLGNSLRIDTLIHADASDSHDLILFDNEEHGRVLAIDGLVQLSTKDEFVYHEMVSHPALVAHGDVKNVLIIGGGDGGALREMLRHPGIEHIRLVEIDPDVISFSKQWLPEISKGAFEDPRVEVVITDGAKFVKSDEDRYDLILIDSSDPVGPSAVLFTREFYTDCKALLNPRGVLVTQSGLVSVHPEPVANTAASFRELFEFPGFCLICVPAFSGGFMALGFATDASDIAAPNLQTLRDRWAALDISTRYYSPDMHQAAFVLPPFVEAIVRGQT